MVNHGALKASKLNHGATVRRTKTFRTNCAQDCTIKRVKTDVPLAYTSFTYHAPAFRLHAVDARLTVRRRNTVYRRGFHRETRIVLLVLPLYTSKKTSIVTVGEPSAGFRLKPVGIRVENG
jgi:hypothetical protein